MERKIEIEVSLKGLDVEEIVKFCQGDKNTQFMAINFLEDIELENYTLQVYYLPPYPATIPYVDLFTELKYQMLIPIPNKILERNGYVKVELVLSKETDVITINKSFEFEVIKTINGTSLTAYPEGEIKTTIAEQIEKVKQLIAQSQEKIDEYNSNVTNKTTEFNNNSEKKTQDFNDNAEEKVKLFNQNISSILDNANDEISKVTTQAISEAKEDIETHIEEETKPELETYVNETSKVELDNHVENISKKSIDDYIEDTSKVALDNYVETVSKKELETYVNETSKVELDNHVEKNAKESIDNYVTTKEEELKGATFTPAVDEEGNLNFTNDKNLPNPPVVNIKGPKGDDGANGKDGINGEDGAPGAKGEKGDTPVKGVDYYTNEEKQEFTEETVKLVTDEGTKQVELITTKGEEQTNLITQEGTKQMKLVGNQGTLSLETLLTVQRQIEELLKNQEVNGNALSLNGKTGVQYDKEIQGVAGGYSGNFPLTTAVLDGIYLLPETGKFYVCTKAYSGSNLTVPNANFEELSVWKNRDKLSNLYGYKLIKEFESSDFNKEILVFDVNDIQDFYKTLSCIVEVIVTATYDDKWLTSAMKISTLPFKETRHNKELYTFQQCADKIVLNYNSWLGQITATLKDEKAYFKVYVLKLSN